MTRKLLILLLVVGTYCTKAFCCGNEYEDFTKLNGKYKELYDEAGGTSASWFVHGFDTLSLRAEKETLLAKIKLKSNYKDLSDLALIELKIGDRNKGVQLLEDLYQKYPHEYNIVANLGTGYELIGKNELAYKLIKECLDLNPMSHEGSEWIHLKILKQKLRSSPDYKEIIDLKTGQNITGYYEKLPQHRLPALSLIRKQLMYQLMERIAFIPPTDPIVSQLLFDLADLVALTESVERAEDIYKLSKTYAVSEDTRLFNRALELVKAQKFKIIQKYWYWIVFLFITTAIIFIIRKRRRKRKLIYSAV